MRRNNILVLVGAVALLLCVRGATAVREGNSLALELEGCGCNPCPCGDVETGRVDVVHPVTVGSEGGVSKCSSDAKSADDESMTCDEIAQGKELDQGSEEDDVLFSSDASDDEDDSDDGSDANPEPEPTESASDKAKQLLQSSGKLPAVPTKEEREAAEAARKRKAATEDDRAASKEEETKQNNKSEEANKSSGKPKGEDDADLDPTEEQNAANRAEQAADAKRDAADHKKQQDERNAERKEQEDEEATEKKQAEARQNRDEENREKALDDKNAANQNARNAEEDKKQAEKEQAELRKTQSKYPQTSAQRVKLQNGSKSSNVPYSAPAVRRQGQLCFSSGLAITKSEGSLASYPLYCRPDASQHFNSISTKVKPLLMEMNRNGVLTQKAGGASPWATLNGITFPAPAAKLTPIKLESDWANFNDGFGQAGVIREGNLCAVSGLVRVAQGKKWSARIGSVPSDCRPEGRLIFSVNSGGNPHRVDILPSGAVVWVTGEVTAPWLSLAGILYTVKEGAEIKLASGFTAYGSGYRGPTYTREGRVCVINGLLRGTLSKRGAALAVLPGNCRPSHRAVFALNQHKASLRVDVLPNGNVIWADGESKQGWLSLSGLSFFIADGSSIEPADGSSLKERDEDKDLENNKESASEVAREKGLMPKVPADAITLATNQEATKDAEYLAPSFARHKSLCVLTGRANVHLNSRVIGKLPTACRPAYHSIFDARDSRLRVLRVDALPDGTVKYAGSYEHGTTLDFDGIKFPVAGSQMTELKPERYWSVYGPAPLKVTQDGNVCAVSGSVKFSDAKLNKHILTLPKDCKPDARVIFHASAGDKNSWRVDVDTSGRLLVSYASGDREGIVSLDGIVFSTETGTAVSFSEGFSNYNSGFRTPSVTKQGNLCVVSGLVRGSLSSGKTIFTLPEACRPGKTLVFYGNQHEISQRLFVSPDGAVTWKGGAAVRRSWISVDGMAFTTATSAQQKAYRQLVASQKAKAQAAKADAAASKAAANGGLVVKDLHFKHGLTYDHFGPEYNEPAVTRIGELCVASGFMSVTTKPDHTVHHTEAGHVGEGECWPKQNQVIGFHGHGEHTFSAKLYAKDGKLRLNDQKPGNWVSLDGVTWPARAATLKPLTLDNAWKNAVDYGAASATKQGPVCVVSGLLQRLGNSWGKLARLPAECRPKARHVVSANAHGATVRVDITPDGWISWINGEHETLNNHLSLANIIVPVDVTGPVSLTKGYSKMGGPYQEPGYTRHGPLCVLSGLVKGRPSTTLPVGTLPVSCRPNHRTVFSVNQHATTLRLDVYPDGRIYYKDGSIRYSWVSLNGVQFIVGDNNDYGGVVLASQIMPFGHGAQSPSVDNVGSICIMQGVANTWRSLNGAVATIDDACRPKYRSIFDQAVTGNAITRLDVQSNKVYYSGGSRHPGYLSFSGMVWPASNAKPGAMSAGPGWVSYGSIYGGPTFTVEGDLCVLNGLVKNKNGAKYFSRQKLIATLPPACRPKGGKITLHANHASGLSSRVDIAENGQVSWVAGQVTHNWISLSGIAFPVQNSDSVKLPLEKFVQAYGNGYRTPQYKLQGNLCMLSGRVKSRIAIKAGYKFAELPEECRPQKGNLFFTTNHHDRRLRVDIQRNGDVIMGEGVSAYNWISLDGIVFRMK